MALLSEGTCLRAELLIESLFSVPEFTHESCPVEV